MIEAKLLKGFLDYSGAEAMNREQVMAKLVQGFKKSGYSPLETPILEYAEILMGKFGEEGDKLMYHFKDHGERHIAMKYDHTVSFARFFAKNFSKLALPYKRYQVGPSFRADKPQKGRLRQFHQIDIDIIGTESIHSDIDIVSLTLQSLQNLGLENFVLKINDRALVDSIFDGIGIDHDKKAAAFTALDKLEKIGVEKVKELLYTAGISKQKTQALCDLLDFKGSNQEILAHLEGYATARLAQIVRTLENIGLAEKVQIDLSIVRGLDYYTGIVFETFHNDKSIGSFGSGGRYDDLCNLFCKQNFSGIGYSFGLDRLLLAMQNEDLLDDKVSDSKVLVTVYGPDTYLNSLAALKELHAAGISAEVSLVEEKLAKQMRYADRKGIPYVMVLGPEEIESQKVVLKNMQTGEQEVLDLSAAFSRLS